MARSGHWQLTTATRFRLLEAMSNRTPIFERDDHKAYLWLAALALLGVFSRAPDFSILRYVLNFGVACLVLLSGTVACRRLGAESRFRDAVALFAFMAVFALLLFPMRSPATSTGSLVLGFLAVYFVLAAIVYFWKMVSGSIRPKR